jgi:nitroreductase
MTRMSAPRLLEPGPDAAALEVMLGAAMRAPDHGRLRPWRFIVIQGAGRARFGELMAESLQRRMPTAAAARLQAERERALRAPLIVVVAAKIQPAAKIPAVEQLLSAGAAAQNLLIAAHALGFAGAWKTGDVAYDAEVKAALGLEEGDAVVGFLYLGSSAGGPVPPRPGFDPAAYISHFPQ